MKVTRSELSGREDGVNELLCHAILGSLSDKVIEKLPDEMNDAKVDFEIKMTIDGIDINPSPFFKDLHKRMDDMVERRALELLRAKYGEVFQKISSFSNNVEEYLKSLLTAAGVDCHNEDERW